MDVTELGELIQHFFARGIAKRTAGSYSSAQRRFLVFCDQYQLHPLPLSERILCLFSVYLAQQGVQPQSISSYLSALRHLQVSAGLPAPNRTEWPRLQYVLKGIRRSQPSNSQPRLPITIPILRKLLEVWAADPHGDYESRLLWAAACLGFFGFLRSGEFTLSDLQASPPILSSGVAIDSRENPTVIRVHLRHAKTDPFGKGVAIFLGRTSATICPVSAILNFLAVRPSGVGPLFVHQDGTPLLRAQFVAKLKDALSAAGVDNRYYSGHSFRIGAATTAAAAGVPDHIIKMLGRWESSAYQLYVRTPRSTLASVSRQMAS